LGDTADAPGDGRGSVWLKKIKSWLLDVESPGNTDWTALLFSGLSQKRIGLNSGDDKKKACRSREVEPTVYSLNKKRGFEKENAEGKRGVASMDKKEVG